MNMKQVLVEEFCESLDCDVYPITFIKFFLNKKRILFYFTKAASKDFDIRVRYKIDYSDCPACKEKLKESNLLCRPHTSIQRVLNADKVAFDVNTKTYFYKNEIFKMVDDKLVIVYCPHPKMIEKDITDFKVRKIKPITIHDPKLTHLPNFKNVRKFNSVQLFENSMKCWFNNNFSIVTIPENKHGYEWCLIANK